MLGTPLPVVTEYNLCELAAIRLAFVDSGAVVVVHTATTVGGIGANRESPGRYFYDNEIMGIELLEEAPKFCVEKCTILGTIFAYPKHTPVTHARRTCLTAIPR
jgi:dTDP-glucose 4,6-dehydratase/GDP-L-fucose synthase